MKLAKYALMSALCLAALSCGHKRGSSDSMQNSSSMAAKSICGSRTLMGDNVPDIRNGACGVDNPVKVYSVGGISLSPAATVNCKTALALEHWVNSSARPAASRIRKSLTGMSIAGSYVCRTRNHQKGGRLSEHAFGNAIDISAFTFSDGSKLTVKEAYRQYQPYFETVRKQACGTFGTVLGPGVRLHDDHFHFDTAYYSSGPYCK